jgi:hypothetical protein
MKEKSAYMYYMMEDLPCIVLRDVPGVWVRLMRVT